MTYIILDMVGESLVSTFSRLKIRVCLYLLITPVKVLLTAKYCFQAKQKKKTFVVTNFKEQKIHFILIDTNNLKSHLNETTLKKAQAKKKTPNIGIHQLWFCQ